MQCASDLSFHLTPSKIIRCDFLHWQTVRGRLRYRAPLWLFLLALVRLDLLLLLCSCLLRRATRADFFLIGHTLPGLCYVKQDAPLFFAVYPRSGLSAFLRVTPVLVRLGRHDFTPPWYGSGPTRPHWGRFRRGHCRGKQDA
jgi:hypothetical protein